MYSMADKARNNVLGNHSWDEVRSLPIDQATTMVIGMINRHMTTLSCTSKKDYDRFCNLSPAEAETKRTAEANAGFDLSASAASTKTQQVRTLATTIAGLLDKSPLDERMAAMNLIARSVADEQRRIFAGGLLSELVNIQTRYAENATWIAAA